MKYERYRDGGIAFSPTTIEVDGVDDVAIFPSTPTKELVVARRPSTKDGLGRKDAERKANRRLTGASQTNKQVAMSIYVVFEKRRLAVLSASLCL